MAVSIYTDEEILAESKKISPPGSLESCIRAILASDVRCIEDHKKAKANLKEYAPMGMTRCLDELFISSLLLVARERAIVTLTRLNEFRKVSRTDD
jgi:hypothetical protein